MELPGLYRLASVPEMGPANVSWLVNQLDGTNISFMSNSLVLVPYFSIYSASGG